uniref:Putative secreted peptide n=1 Tax=Anopheles braziliensis TaxID=58242 RepID=A0A2M3ZMF0_9DIPT
METIVGGTLILRGVFFSILSSAGHSKHGDDTDRDVCVIVRTKTSQRDGIVSFVWFSAVRSVSEQHV